MEKAFQEFKNNKLCHYSKENIDYFGINITSHSMDNIFKIYLKGIKDRNIDHILVKYLNENNMVRYLTEIDDSQENVVTRIDIGIKNRTDENMEKLFQWLRVKYPIFQQYEKEIIKLAKMKITPLPEHNYSSMYFVGSTSFLSGKEILKCHYYNGYISDPDNLISNLQFYDDYYLNYIKNMDASEWNQLADMAEYLLKNSNGHMWVTGTDYSSDGKKKYKIYIRNIDKSIYYYLRKILNQNNYDELEEKVDDVLKWNERHDRYVLKGIALGLNTEKKMSVNFYYEIANEIKMLSSD